MNGSKLDESLMHPGQSEEERQHGKRRHFWIVRSKSEWESKEGWEPEEGTDIWALLKDRISITPLHSNLTSPTALSALKRLSNTIFQDLGNPKNTTEKS